MSRGTAGRSWAPAASPRRGTDRPRRWRFAVPHRAWEGRARSPGWICSSSWRCVVSAFFLVALHLAAFLLDVFLELPVDRLEGLVHRDVRVLVLLLARDDLAAGDVHVDAHLEVVALLLPAVALVHDH